MSSPVSRFCNWLDKSKPCYSDHRGQDLVYQSHELVLTSTRNNIKKPAVEFKAYISTVGDIRRAARFVVARMTDDSGMRVALHRAHAKDNGRIVVFVNVLDNLQGSSDNSLDELFQRKSKSIQHASSTAKEDQTKRNWTKTKDFGIQVELNQVHSRDDERREVCSNVINSSQKAMQQFNDDEISEEKAIKYAPDIAVPVVIASTENMSSETEDSGVHIAPHQACAKYNSRHAVSFKYGETSYQGLQRSNCELSMESRNKSDKKYSGELPADKASEEYVIFKDARATRKATFNGSEVMLPVIVRSQGVSTDVVTSQPIETKPPKRCEIPLDYDGPEFADKISMSYLTNTNVYERVRLQLAYFRHERSASINLMSYVNNKVFLASSGLPQDDTQLERIYYKFCAEKGITKEEVVKDMEATKREMDNKWLSQKSASRRNFDEYYLPQHHGPGVSSSSGCDPELCSIM